MNLHRDVLDIERLHEVHMSVVEHRIVAGSGKTTWQLVCALGALDFVDVVVIVTDTHLRGSSLLDTCYSILYAMGEDVQLSEHKGSSLYIRGKRIMFCTTDRVLAIPSEYVRYNVS